jgi:transcriptional regulator with XRE-family HTH domain
MNSKRLLKVLAHNIHLNRMELSLTQSEAAKKANLSLRQYQKIEAGNANPTVETLCQLGLAFDATADELLRVKKIRTVSTPDKYVEDFRSKFESESVAAAVRTLTGVLMWGNHMRKNIDKLVPNDEPVDLMKVLKGPALEIFRTQLMCEQQGLALTYMNFFTDRVTGESAIKRMYPTLVLPESGVRPMFTAVYITSPESDTSANYYRFCSRMLSIP